MGIDLKHLPHWLLVVLLFVTAGFLSYAVYSGRGIKFGPLDISPDARTNSECPADINELQDQKGIEDKKWRFGRNNGQQIAPSTTSLDEFITGANGYVGGFKNPNEHRWEVRNNQLIVYDGSGNATTSYALVRCDWVIVLTGDGRQGFSHVLSRTFP